MHHDEHHQEATGRRQRSKKQNQHDHHTHMLSVRVLPQEHLF